MSRIRGLFALAVDATVHGSRAIEKIQIEKARLPFEVLEAVPMIAGPVKVIHTAHDFGVAATHASIRAVASGVGEAARFVLDAVDEPEPVAHDEDAKRDGARGGDATDAPRSE